MAIMAERGTVGYKCRSLNCRGSHACHPNGSPVGTPAVAKVRKARIRAHAAFDRLWQSKLMTRDRAYAWMRERLGLTEDESHIGRFDETMCQRLVETVRNCHPELFPFDGDDVTEL